VRTLSFWRAEGRLVGLFVLLLVATFGLGMLVLRTLETTIRAQLGAVLTATLQTSSTAVESDLDELLRAAGSLHDDPALTAHGVACSSGAAADCAEVRERLHALVRGGRYLWGGFISRDGQVLAEAGTRPTAVLRPELRLSIGNLSGTGAEQLQAHAGPAGALLPLVVPIAAGAGVIWLDAKLTPVERVVRAARTGRSGETYLFDRSGRLLTQSRFAAQLLSSMSTRAVVSATAGQSGVDLDGYPDYRGVPVVGAWRWLPALELGVVTELDVVDAYRSLGGIQRLFAAVLGLLGLALLGTMLAALRARREHARAARAELRAERFGQYELEQKLGEGGMGVVYLARHALLRRKAAIKLLRPDRVSEDAFRRFESEAQLTSTLSHPNTVDVYDFGRSASGEFYYVMEYLEGLDLQRLVVHFGPLPEARVVHFLRQLCDSLSEAHELGMVHRDIKPANLFACTRGGIADTLKVLDFGIAQIGRADADAIGTAAYMAPELFESPDSVSARSDLYAVGVVAQFLLTGLTPFAGDSTQQIAQAQLTRTPEPIVLPDGAQLDPALGAAIRACLARNPDSRPASARSLHKLLGASPLCGRWTGADADAWWAAHHGALSTFSGGTPLSSRQSLILQASSQRIDAKLRA
jgi:tRNA A-37 threonylcarbamoyl transferase component Bud32